MVDMYFNEGMRDSHGFDHISRCIGRYSAQTNSFHDGAVNEKLAEIIGIVERNRRSRHPGDLLLTLIEQYSKDHPALRTAARHSWVEVLQGYSGPLPDFVRDLIA
jgi:hypothetical protein